jgi:hypothetical protein
LVSYGIFLRIAGGSLYEAQSYACFFNLQKISVKYLKKFHLSGFRAKNFLLHFFLFSKLKIKTAFNTDFCSKMIFFAANLGEYAQKLR